MDQQHRLPSVLVWLLGYCVVVGAACLSTGGIFSAIYYFVQTSPFIGVHFLCRWLIDQQQWRQSVRWLLLLVVPCVLSGWIVFEKSAFYGKPRRILRIALKENPPVLLWVDSFYEDDWTDYCATLKVRLDPAYLKKALDNHFRLQRERNGVLEYDRPDMKGQNGFCTVETDAAFSYAIVEYAVD